MCQGNAVSMKALESAECGFVSRLRFLFWTRHKRFPLERICSQTARKVYEKRTFIEIDTNLRKFSAIFSTWFSKKLRIIGKMKKTFFLHITMDRCWNLKDFRDQVSDKSAPHNFHRDLNCYQNIMYTHLAIITTKVLKQQRIALTRTKVNISCYLCIRVTTIRNGFVDIIQRRESTPCR